MTGGISGGIRANKMGLDFWDGTGTMEMLQSEALPINSSTNKKTDFSTNPMARICKVG